MSRSRSIALALAVAGMGIVTEVGYADAPHGTHYWQSNAGGAFQDTGRWDFGIPSRQENARFDRSGAYTVTFSTAHTNNRFLVGDDRLVLDLNGYWYQMLSPSATSVGLGLIDGDVARVTLRNGLLSNVDTSIGAVAGTDGGITVSTGATWACSGSLAVGANGRGNMTVTNAGSVLSASGRVGTGAGAVGTVMISSEAATWQISNDLLIGGLSSGTGTVELRPGGGLWVGTNMDLRATGTFNLTGGTLTVGSMTNANPAKFNFSSGAVNYIGQDHVVGTSGPMGNLVTMGTGKAMAVVLNTRVDPQSQLQMGGGAYYAGSVLNNGQINFTNPASTFTTSLLNNTGLVNGNGTVGATTTINYGQALAQGSDRLYFPGEFTNYGRVNVSSGGTVEFAKAIVNEGGGRMEGSGTLRFNNGVVNNGQMSFPTGTSNVYGTVSNQAAITVSGDSVSFLGPVNHNGTEIRANPGSTAVFGANVAGVGNFTGGGMFRFQRNYSPGLGTVPASIFVDGAVYFESTADLALQLGPARLVESINATQAVRLNQVNFAVDSGFAPQIGDVYTLVSSAVGITYGGSVNLPALNYPGLTFKLNQGPTALTLTVVPEPSSMLVLGGIASVGLLGRRRRR